MDMLEGLKFKLENKGYRIELSNEFNYGIRMNLRRDKGYKTMDHGTIFLQKEDIDSLIEGLIYMNENINRLD